MTTAPVRSHKKLVFLLLSATFVLFGLVAYFGLIKPQQQAKALVANIKIDGVILPEPQAIQSFHLMDNKRKEFTQDNLKGHWSLLFFGFSNCGMVCPTALSALNEMYKTLQQQLPDNKLPQVVFITVDPDRDTVERLDDYINSFNSHFIAVRGETPEIDAVKKQFHIAAAKMQAEGSAKNNYMINHTAEILVINPNGQLQAFLSFPHTAEELVKDYKSLLMVPYHV